MEGMTGSGVQDPTTVGPYRLVRRIGEGGMGVVHLALDQGGRAVALKVLRTHVAADPDARLRLSREVETLRRVRHARVAEVLDADVVGQLPYLVTRFVPGKTLDQYVLDTGPLPAEHVADLGLGGRGTLSKGAGNAAKLTLLLTQCLHYQFM